MAVTRLERKARRNKTRAKVRVQTIKRNLNRVFVKSPYKEESGVVIEVEDVFKSVEENNKNLPVKSAPVAKETTVEKVEETAEVTPEVKEVKAKKPATKKPATKKETKDKPEAKKPAAKKTTAKKPAAKKAAPKKTATTKGSKAEG